MKVFIHTDLEGVSGIGDAGSPPGCVFEKGHSVYPEMVQLLLGDVHAAVEGAVAGGATAVTVLDSHGGGGNFTAGDLEGKALYDPKANKLWWGMLDESYDATFFIGAHAMAGTLRAFFDHTQCSNEWFEARLNNRPFGELGQWAAVAAEFGVPLVMVAGDAAACDEARTFFDPVETAVVKQGRCRLKADCAPLDIARGRIHEAARKAMSLVGRAKPLALKKPIEFTLTCSRTDVCDQLAGGDVERIDARTIRWVRENGFGLYPWYPPMDRKGRPRR
jgi:D-amino peptidase